MQLPSYIAGKPVNGGASLEVRYPWDATLTGSVTCVGQEHLEEAIQRAIDPTNVPLNRYERHAILRRAAGMLAERREEFASLMTRESGLAKVETLYETKRSSDVLEFAAMEALRDDGQSFSCDISPNGKARKIFTTREPLNLVGAITPFNHPLNQVVHKIAPAVAIGAPLILKPSEKTPLTATRFVELLYAAGLPGWMLSVLHGGLETLTRPLICDGRVELITFTGSASVGKDISCRAGYKKLCLELGGHSPMIVMEDADLDLAVGLAAEGCFRNSGQRCTSVRRLLVHERLSEEFTHRLVAKAATYVCGDPEAPDTRVGTVIDEKAALQLESAIQEAVGAGATLLLGGTRRGALLQPTVLGNVPRTARMATVECFGPIAPVYPIRDLKDALQLANATSYGLSSSIITNKLEDALTAVKRIHAGTVNVNEIPGYRLELSPFGGVKDSGLGIKEGVIEAMKFMSHVKTFSLPW